MASKRASEAGLTLLELSLSLAMGTVLITSFFIGYRGLMQAIRLASNEVNGTARVAELFETIANDLDRADNASLNVSADGFTVTFKIGGADYGYRLVSGSAGSPNASQDVYVERQQNGGPWSPVGGRKLIANFHPYEGTLKDDANGDVTGYNPVPLFVLVPDVGGLGGNSPQVVMHAVVQTSPDAAARYVRTRATPRLIP